MPTDLGEYLGLRHAMAVKNDNCYFSVDPSPWLQPKTSPRKDHWNSTSNIQRKGKKGIHIYRKKYLFPR